MNVVSSMTGVLQHMTVITCHTYMSHSIQAKQQTLIECDYQLELSAAIKSQTQDMLKNKRYTSLGSGTYPALPAALLCSLLVRLTLPTWLSLHFDFFSPWL